VEASIAPLFVYLLLALSVSFLCSLVEAGLLSVRRSQISVLVEAGRPSGRLLESMKEQIDRPLAAILTLNTVAHTFGAAGVGAQAQRIFGEYWIALISAAVTLLILVLSEIVPKTLGAVKARTLAPFTAYTVQAMIWITLPLIYLLDAVARLIGSRRAPPVSREEVAATAALGRAAGTLDERESVVIRNVLRLDQVRVEDVMTPRSVVFMLKKDLTVEEVIKTHALPFSRIPIYGESPDQITGLVLRHGLLEAWHQGRGGERLEKLSRPIAAIPEVATVEAALEQFLQRQEHILLAVDEFGGTAGVITLEDAVETLLGVEIVDETDTASDMRQLARERAETRRRAREASPPLDLREEGQA
jgi:CBS domain containing-hemolysin-like protein